MSRRALGEDRVAADAGLLCDRGVQKDREIDRDAGAPVEVPVDRRRDFADRRRIPKIELPMVLVVAPALAVTTLVAGLLV